MISGFELISNIVKSIQISQKGFDSLILNGSILQFLFQTIVDHDRVNSQSVVRLSKAVLELLYCTCRGSFEKEAEQLAESEKGEVVSEVC